MQPYSIFTELRRYPSALRAYWDVWNGMRAEDVGKPVRIGVDPRRTMKASSEHCAASVQALWCRTHRDAGPAGRSAGTRAIAADPPE